MTFVFLNIVLRYVKSVPSLINLFITGIDEDDIVPPTEASEPASTEDMPPLEADDDDASRMEEVD